LTFKFFDIRILPDIFVNPAPSKTFTGWEAGGYSQIHLLFPNLEQRLAGLFRDEIHSP
jgi:hypothetical protein